MKNKIKTSLVLIFVMIIVNSCTNKPKADEVIIEGKLMGESFSQIVVEELTPDGVQKIDSVSVINNKFNIKLKVVETGFYFLRFSSTNFLSLILEPGSLIKIVAPADSLGYPTEITGCDENLKMLELNHRLDGCYRVTDSLSKIFEKYQGTELFDSVKVTIDSAYYDMFYSHKAWLQEYIHKNSASITTIVAFYQTLGRRSFFRSEDDFGIMQAIDNNLQKRYPKNKHVAKFHQLFLNQKVFEDQRLKAEALLENGKQLPLIVLPNEKGEKMDVSKMVAPQKLILFWNIKSLVDHPDKVLIKNGLNKYKVVAVSFDYQQEIWLGYAPKEYPRFTHLIDSDGLQGLLARTFNITETNIPYFILVDQKNQILSKGTSLKEVLGIK